MATRGVRTGLLRLGRSGALGAIVAQIWQAAGSFAIQILAARQLGATGLAAMSLCLGVMVLAAAIASGLVGDSLTVLDRSRPGVRAALQFWTVVMALVAPLAGVGFLSATGILGPGDALVFALGCAVYLVEELLRRVLTATMHFWRLVVVDTAALTVTLGTLAALGSGGLTLRSFLWSVAVGQFAGCLAAIATLPAQERWLAPMRAAELARVWGFGIWRGLQVAVNPTAQTALRALVIGSAGLGVMGQLEAARIFVAPATLVVQGLGSFLLASYARDKSRRVTTLVRRATRASAALFAGALAIGGLAALAVPYAGHLVAGEVGVSQGAVLAWAGYAAAVATVQPFASLAAARGAPRLVLLVRVGDVALGLGLVVLALHVLHWPADLAPLALAVGLLVGGLVLRNVVLPKIQRDAYRAGHPGTTLLVDGTTRGTRGRVREYQQATRGRVRDNAIAGV